MPLDIQQFRADQGGDPAIVEDSCKKRFMKNPGPEIVQQIIDVDNEWRKLRGDVDKMNKEFRKSSKEVGEMFKKHKQGKLEGGEATINSAREANKKMKEDIENADKRRQELEDERAALLYRVGNLVHDSVPVSANEDDNIVVKKWGTIKPTTGKERHHYELLHMIGGYEPERASRIAGGRCYFLTGPGVMLNLALQQYGLNVLTKHGYTPTYPPFFMKKSMMKRTAQLEDFDDQLYHLSTAGAEDSKDDETEKYLIATSEQPISAMHANEWLEPQQLPIKYGGLSTCFRKEAGKSGKDVWGIYRVHQFEKIEQFVYCSPDESWRHHEEMLAVAEEFYQSLNIPYRVVNIVSGELNNAAAKKYDLEGYFPGFIEDEVDERYKELVSCSNCTDYQARGMETRFGHPTQAQNLGHKEKQYVHMLNATLCATTRTICAILENYQTHDGIHIPQVLQPYCGGQTFIPFIKPPPINVSDVKNEKAEARRKRGEVEAEAQRKTEKEEILKMSSTNCNETLSAMNLHSLRPLSLFGLMQPTFHLTKTSVFSRTLPSVFSRKWLPRISTLRRLVPV